MTRLATEVRESLSLQAIIIFLISNYPIQQAISTSTGESHGAMSMEQIAERSGKMNQVLHDSRMMIEVNSYKISETINKTLNTASIGSKYLLLDLSIRNIGHTLKLSPNLFVLKTDTGEVAPSSLTSYVEAGLRPIYVADGQTIRTVLIFELPSFDNSPQILDFSDGSSYFSFTLVPTQPPQSPILGSMQSPYRIGETMEDHSLKVLANVSSTEKTGNFEARSDTNSLKISLLFQNLGNDTIRIDPSYVFILDNKSYVYGVNEAASNSLSSPLRKVDLEPAGVISGHLIVEVPKDSKNLIFMYAGPSNSFLARTF